jgi:CheY-like chemotaxis protein
MGRKVTGLKLLGLSLVNMAIRTQKAVKKKVATHCPWNRGSNTAAEAARGVVETGVLRGAGNTDLAAPALRPYKAHIDRMQKKRILFIDDESLLRELMYEMLSEMDYEVKVEESGEKGIRTFTEHPEAFDLVLTDFTMLNMMGDEVAKRIRSIRADVPVVVMTGTPDNLPRSKAEAAGICKVLPKPLMKAELREGLRGIV